MVVAPRTEDIAELLGITFDELLQLSEYEFQTRILEWWVQHMETAYDE